ncbi:MAG: Rrf2 family transcriptional regulator [Alphaproteobacteria bacterium]
MKLSTRGQYAVIALVDIATQSSGAVVSLADIAQRQEISQRYLEQLFAKLRRHGLVQGVKGASGGYRITRNINDVTLLDIMKAVDEPIKTTRCDALDRGLCRPGGTTCQTHRIWMELGDTISGFLQTKTLADFLPPQSRPVS